MSRWTVKIEPYKEVVFEVVGKNTEWGQFARIKAFPGREYRLGDAIGSKLTVSFNDGDSLVHFMPYGKDEGGNVRPCQIRCYNEADIRDGWTLYMESGEGVDFDDYIVRITIVDAKKERVEDFQKLLAGLEHHQPVIE